MHLIRMYGMKYKEKVTYRTTASGGQEIITEQVPVYNKFEQFAKKQHDKKVNKLKDKGKPIKIPFIIRHPGVCAFILGVFIILVVYLISSANSYMDELIKQYTTLTAKTNDSKYSFDKKLFYVTVEADGTKKITFGYKSEEQQEQAEQAADEAANTGNSPDSSNGNTSPSSDGVFELLADTKGTYSYDGVALSVTANNGQEFPLYSGIPAEWGWNSDTSAVVWHYGNTADAWVSNFSSETGATSCSTYKTLNKEFPRSDLSTVDGVKCLQICSNAGIKNVGFTPSGAANAGVNDLYGDVENKRGVIVILDENTGNYYYMPVYTTDSKAHTYPGGVVQTGCARYSKFYQVYDKSDDSCSDFGKGHAALHSSSGHYDYSDRPASVEIEANWIVQPIKSGWKIVDVLIER